MIHRIIKQSIHEGLSDKALPSISAKKQNMRLISHRSPREKQSKPNARSKSSRKPSTSAIMSERSFDGVISGVTGFGIYVQLENTVEGLVRIDELRDDYYDYRQRKIRPRREGVPGTLYRLGDEVRVMVDHVDLEKHEIDFLIAGHL